MNLKYLDSSDVESHDEEEGDYEIEEEKEQEIRGNCILEMIIFSSPMLSELFYIRKVLDFSVADQPMEDWKVEDLTIDTSRYKIHQRAIP